MEGSTDLSGTRLKRSKKGKLNREESMLGARRKKIEYYLTHHKIKTQLENGEYKNACDLMFQMEQPESPYLPIYYQDQLLTVNKLLKYYIQVEEYAQEYVGICFRRAKEVIPRMYQLFMVEESLQWELKSVKETMNKDLAKFLTLLIDFIMKAAHTRLRQGKLVESMFLFDQLFALTQNLVDSSTNDRKLLRKVGQALLCYAAFLMESNYLQKAINVLLLALKNETNVLLVLSFRFKTVSPSISKRIVGETYSRLSAVLFNLATIFQAKKKTFLTLLFLNQCKEIDKLKTKLTGKETSTIVYEYFQNAGMLYEQYMEITKIVGDYFSLEEIKVEPMRATFNRHRKTEDSQLQLSSVGTANRLNSIHNKTQTVGHQRKLIKKSVSLKQRLDEDRQKIKSLGHQMLFYGVKLFDKVQQKEKRRNMSTTNFLQPAYSQTRQEMRGIKDTRVEVKRYGRKTQGSGLKKNGRKKKNAIFREIQEPVEYELMKKRFSAMWKQDGRQIHKTREQICLLNYKSNQLHFQKLYKGNGAVHEQIQINSHIAMQRTDTSQQ